MSEKVVLTQEQADAIELWLSKYEDKDQLLMIQYFVKVKEADASSEGWIGGYKPMKELTISQLARAIHVGYEVEKLKFQAGDKVIRIDGLTFARREFIWTVVEDQEESWKVKVVGSADDWDVIWETSSIRHATAEEIFWLHELGRKRVPDFHVGDAIATFEDEDIDVVVKDDCYIRGKVGIHNAEDWFESGIIKGIYPVESFKPFKKEA